MIAGRKLGTRNVFGIIPAMLPGSAPVRGYAAPIPSTTSTSPGLDRETPRPLHHEKSIV